LGLIKKNYTFADRKSQKRESSQSSLHQTQVDDGLSCGEKQNKMKYSEQKDKRNQYFKSNDKHRLKTN